MSPEERLPAEGIRRAQVAISQQFSGPLPPPEILAKYEQILPGAADRIIKMAESQQSHRQRLEQKVIESNTSAQKWGVACGFILAMTAVCGGIWLSLRGMSGTGLTTIIGALAALVGVFVYGKSAQDKQLKKKSEAFANTVSEGQQ